MSNGVGLSRRDLFKAGLAILAGVVVGKINSVEAAVIPPTPPDHTIPRIAKGFKKRSLLGMKMSVVRTTYPNQLARMICDVQPLTVYPNIDDNLWGIQSITANTGQIFKLKVKYQDFNRDGEESIDAGTYRRGCFGI